jgi:Kef-type K+ transport system membrane component KefB
LFLATALTFSSTVVVVKLLDEKGELDSLYGRIAVGIFLVQDLVVIVILTFLAGMGGGEEMDATRIATGLGKAFGGMAVLLLLSLLASRYLLPRPFRWAARSPDVLLVWALSWCFLLVLAAHAFGLSLEVGAFLAGLEPRTASLQRRPAAAGASADEPFHRGVFRLAGRAGWMPAARRPTGGPRWCSRCSC